MTAAMSISDAVAVLQPAMPRRELARRLADVAPVDVQYGSRGRRPARFPLATIMRIHRQWCDEKARRLQAEVVSCQNSGEPQCVSGRTG